MISCLLQDGGFVPILLEFIYDSKGVESVLYNWANCALWVLVVLYEILNWCGILESKSCDISGLRLIMNCDCVTPCNWW